MPVFLRPASKKLKFTPDELAACITGKTKWQFLKRPSNPSGMGIRRLIDGYCRGAATTSSGLYHCDDIYEHLTYGIFSFATLADVACFEPG